jgi:hypothetical protein
MQWYWWLVIAIVVATLVAVIVWAIVTASAQSVPAGKGDCITNLAFDPVSKLVTWSNLSNQGQLYSWQVNIFNSGPVLSGNTQDKKLNVSTLGLSPGVHYQLTVVGSNSSGCQTPSVDFTL